MKQDKQKTKVLFLLEKGSRKDVWAFFPDEIHNEFFSPNGQKVTSYMAYAHVGQHTCCNLDYAHKCRQAKPSQYNDLKIELESIGYNLEILN